MNQFMCTVKVYNEPTRFGTDNKFIRFKGQVKKNYIPKDSKTPCDFFDFVCFRESTAEFIAKYFKQGDYMLVKNAEVVNNNYEKDGKTVYGTQININEVEFFGSKGESGDTASAEETKPAKKASAPATTEDEFDGF